MPYATPSQALTYLDARAVGDLVNDTGVRVFPSDLLTNPVFLAALSTAAGQINAAALVGERYTILELQSLTGDDAAYLQMINSWLALGVLCARRGRDAKEHVEYVNALTILDQLREGSAIFNVAADVSAGIPQTNFVSSQTYSTVNSLRTRTPHYFPQRVPQYPAPIGG